MISQNTLMKSPYFNSLDHVQKQIVSKKIIREKITLGVKMSELQSFDFWVSNCNPTERVKLIVSELAEDKNESE